MPLELLLVLVVGGIAGIAVLLHLTGASRRFDLSDAEAVRTGWARHFPQDTVTAVHLAPGGMAAMVETRGGPGLIRSFGADTVAHRIRGADAVARGLRLRFDDFGAPPVVVAMPAAMAADWLGRLAATERRDAA
ncbi:MAG: hypothetical protein KF887_07610 [Paracoccaceae bacterium]|nr:MAG: hypothetical protein KF887_07610 [Paracoccaceae bacterium]